MATQKPISTISYNTEGFLKEKLEAWVKAHIIQSYMYIKHKGEDGDKDHIHLRVEPNKKLDPMELTEALKEYVSGSDKPLGCRPWRPSKEEDWVLYAVHDADYMKLKYASDKSEKLPYEWQDIQASEGYDVEIAYIRARQALKHNSANLAKQLSSGSSALNLVQEGENPFIVRALLQTLDKTNFEKLSAEFEALRVEHGKLLVALQKAGLVYSPDEECIITSDGEKLG